MLLENWMNYINILLAKTICSVDYYDSNVQRLESEIIFPRVSKIYNIIHLEYCRL